LPPALVLSPPGLVLLPTVEDGQWQGNP
jgi:hypothetical protein